MSGSGKTTLFRSGCKDMKICFITDESIVIDSGYLERRNLLLANDEGKEGTQRQGLMLDTNMELCKGSTLQDRKNFRAVFTMNSSTDILPDRAATYPALVNRCVLNWFGGWSDSAVFQGGGRFTTRRDLDGPWHAPSCPCRSTTGTPSSTPWC